MFLSMALRIESRRTNRIMLVIKSSSSRHFFMSSHDQIWLLSKVKFSLFDAS
ncbi:unnamed protein product [Moneuplotes crassus]|uniref:Uncharacterized protein n=1 Tax=Euplotes crassus TaxID=5936 RepID=A0AAD1X564_EUPCR|nr:unnamed protein product [Moneuplotes crassus]